MLDGARALYIVRGISARESWEGEILESSDHHNKDITRTFQLFPPLSFFFLPGIFNTSFFNAGGNLLYSYWAFDITVEYAVPRFTVLEAPL